MKSKNIKYSVLFLLFLILGFSVGIMNPSPLATQDIQDINSPKSSAGEITIITPENRTYAQPDSGYYPATYGFENDLIGSNPSGWIPYEGGGTLEVVDEHLNHRNVLKYYRDTNPPEWVYITHNFATKINGTIEFWVLIDDISEFMGLELEGSGSHILFFGIKQSKWMYVPSNWQVVPNVPDPQNNTWHHVSIHFEASTNGYKDLEQYELEIIIDGVSSGELPFLNNQNGADSLELRNGRDEYDYYGYFDAVGFSWDSNYKLEDNLNQGLLLRYDNTTILDWQGYSLDGQANRTILGNVTIPMPADGGHNIRIFGNDTMGTMYESNLRYFTVNTAPPLITINSPTDSQIIGSTAPIYDISIAGPYDSIWYALEGGANYTASGLTGTVDQSAWSALSDGIITIDFYANNSAGMEGSAQVQVIKSVTEQPPGIPGYDLIALIGVISIFTIIIIKRKSKK